jgi:hypothetical protein
MREGEKCQLYFIGRKLTIRDDDASQKGSDGGKRCEYFYLKKAVKK